MIAPNTNATANGSPKSQWAVNAMAHAVKMTHPTGIDQRRQNAQQHKLRREFQLWQPGDQRQTDACDNEKDRRSDIQLPRGNRHHNENGEKQQCHLKCGGHRSPLRWKKGLPRLVRTAERMK